MKTLLLPALFLALLLCWGTLPGQNNALDFDGDGDYITLSPIAGWGPNSDFTVEAWFTSIPDGRPCVSNFRRLIAFSGLLTRFEVGACGGNLKIFWQSPTNNGPFTIPTLSGFGIDFEDGNWHCIAVVRSGPLAEIYLDGTLVFSNSTIGTLNTDLFRVGHWEAARQHQTRTG